MKNISKLSLFLIIIVSTLIVGISIAYYFISSKAKKDPNTVEEDTLIINYIDGKAVNIDNLIPITNPDLDTEEFVYKKHFSINSTGTLDQNINIYLEINQNDFDENSLGISLYEGNNKLSDTKISKSGRVLLKDNLYLKNNSTNNYTVIIWLIENNKNQNNQMDNIFKGDFYIEANQIKK